MKRFSILIFALILLACSGRISAQWWNGVTVYEIQGQPQYHSTGRFGTWYYGSPFANLSQSTRLTQSGLVRDREGTFVRTDRNTPEGRFAQPLSRMDLLQETFSFVQTPRFPQNIPLQQEIPPVQVVVMTEDRNNSRIPSPPKQEPLVNFYDRIRWKGQTVQNQWTQNPPVSSEPPLSPEPSPIPPQVPPRENLFRNPLPPATSTRTSTREGSLSQQVDSPQQIELPPTSPFGHVTTFYVPSQKPNRTTAEQLEIVLIQSFDILPLSPLYVDYAKGTAKVTGLVATEADKLKAEQILLTQPGVKRVENLLKVE